MPILIKQNNNNVITPAPARGLGTYFSDTNESQPLSISGFDSWINGRLRPQILGIGCATSDHGDFDDLDSLDSERNKLIGRIKHSEFIPDFLQQRWVKGLKVINVQDSEISENCIRDFQLIFTEWQKFSRPNKSIFDFDDIQLSMFDYDVTLISRQVDRLIWLLADLPAIFKRKSVNYS